MVPGTTPAAMTVGIWYVQALVGRTYIFIRVGHQYIIWIPHDKQIRTWPTMWSSSRQYIFYVVANKRLQNDYWNVGLINLLPGTYSISF